MGRGKRVFMYVTVLVVLAAVQYEPAIVGQASYAVAASKQVGTLRELEQALAASGDLTIHLKSNITVSKCLRVKGNKILNGGGMYQIRRKSASGSTYKGTLVHMQGNILKLRGVTMNGSGRSSGTGGDVNGKLIEINSGTVVLESGTKLIENYNVSSFTDGGGGITVHAGGTAVMKPGSSVRDNVTITGGSGVRIEAGGMFIMEGGTIADNAVIGQRKDTGFDGRGGAIHNRGITLIQGGVIRDNTAAGYEDGGERYGGYGGAVYNQNVLTVTGGTMTNNMGAFAGGAIYTNERSTVTIEGGVICENTSPGQRGGGIYVSALAEVEINGGSICDNMAADGTQIFLASHCEGKLDIRGGTVSGTRDAIYNNGGAVSLLGGKVRSTGCALRVKGTCQIRGGTLQGKQHDVKYSKGALYLSGNPKLRTVYINEPCVIEVDQKLGMGIPCELCPSRYGDGVRLVHITSGDAAGEVKQAFVLRKRGRFTLEAGSDELYISREKYQIVYDANGGQGNMEAQWMNVDERAPLDVCTFWNEGCVFIGWGDKPGAASSPKYITYRDRAAVKNLAQHGGTVRLYALWAKKPVLTSAYDGAVFYEGEYVGRQVLLHGMEAVDEVDGDLTSKIGIRRVILPDKTEYRAAGARLVPTQRVSAGTGEIIYEVTNSFGLRTEYRRTFEVVPNQAPDIAVQDRYFFVDEYKNSSMDRAKEDILSHIRIKDDVETKQQLEKSRTISWGGLDMQREGEYHVTIRIRDQCGHRFYMREGVEEQYGAGKSCEKTFTVYVVRGDNGGNLSGENGSVRFISEEYIRTLGEYSVWCTEPNRSQLTQSFQKDGSSCDEVWFISGEDKKEIRAFAREQANPFCRETNDLFLRKFSYLRKERGS